MSMKKNGIITGALEGVTEESFKTMEFWTIDEIIHAIKCKENSGQPCTCNALVKCTSAENKDETVHIVKEICKKNIMISKIGRSHV